MTRRPSRAREVARRVQRLTTPVVDLARVARGLLGYGWFLRSWRRYRALPGAEPLRWRDAYPQLHDRTPTTPFDPHYFYQHVWAARRLWQRPPAVHVDVGSSLGFVGVLSALTRVVFVDVRPAVTGLPRLHALAADIRALPFATGSVTSLSCLHVLEHVGLGRYGDAQDPSGSRRAASELARVVAPGGTLLLSTPVGRPRVCFNAHRIHAAEEILDALGALELVEFSGVHDDGRYVENVSIREFQGSEYACGLFWLTLPRHPHERTGS